jgi:iron complex transport system permease protein
MKNKRNIFELLAGLSLILGVSYVALGIGDQWISPLSSLTHDDALILWQLRFPRLVTAFAVGGMLALAGAWFQVLLGNPLAEPYVLGVAGSSSVGAVSALVMIPGSTLALAGGAFAGAWLGIFAVMSFAHLGQNRLLLAGVVLAAFWSAVLALILALLPGRDLVVAFAWMMGDVSRGAIPGWLLLFFWGLALACGVALSRSLDALLLGPRHAEALGVDVKRLQRKLLWLASAVTALAVSAAGTIGFVGLVIPHLMRLIFGSLHRPMLIASALGGGMLLMIADSAARTVLAPVELPVGVLTALVGVPVFLYLLVKRVR